MSEMRLFFAPLSASISGFFGRAGLLLIGWLMEGLTLTGGDSTLQLVGCAGGSAGASLLSSSEPKRCRADVLLSRTPNGLSELPSVAEELSSAALGGSGDAAAIWGLAAGFGAGSAFAAAAPSSPAGEGAEPLAGGSSLASDSDLCQAGATVKRALL